jgi:hypothetical protein
MTLLAPYWSAVLEFDRPVEYTVLLDFQQTLHVDSLFLCCFSLESTRLEEAYLRLNHYPRNKGQSVTGIKQVITFMMDTVHYIWLQRNGSLHDDDTTTKLLSYNPRPVRPSSQHAVRQPQMLYPHHKREGDTSGLRGV